MCIVLLCRMRACELCGTAFVAQLKWQLPITVHSRIPEVIWVLDGCCIRQCVACGRVRGRDVHRNKFSNLSAAAATAIGAHLLLATQPLTGRNNGRYVRAMRGSGPWVCDAAAAQPWSRPLVNTLPLTHRQPPTVPAMCLGLLSLLHLWVT
jgi:hypothetical protein